MAVSAEIADKAVKVGQLGTFKTAQDTMNDNKFVAQQEGKGLSTNDFDDTAKSKVDGIESGAQVNVIESISVKDENIVTQEGKALTINMDAYAKKADLATAYRYKGSLADYASLPTEGMETGDVYNIEAADKDHNVNAGDNVAWNGAAWDVLAGVVDLSGYVPKETGKGLSANDFTDELKTKLDGIVYATDEDINALFAD